MKLHVKLYTKLHMKLHMLCKLLKNVLCLKHFISFVTLCTCITILKVNY